MTEDQAKATTTDGGTATTALKLQFPQVVAVIPGDPNRSLLIPARSCSSARYLGIAAMHSTSSFALAVTSAATTTVARTGGGFSGDQNFEYDEFIP